MGKHKKNHGCKLIFFENIGIYIMINLLLLLSAKHTLAISLFLKLFNHSEILYIPTLLACFMLIFFFLFILLLGGSLYNMLILNHMFVVHVFAHMCKYCVGSTERQCEKKKK